MRAAVLVLAVWAVGFGLAAVFVCPDVRRAIPSVGVASPCILVRVDPQNHVVEAARVDTCGDCTPAGAYCIRVVAAPAPARGAP